MSDYLNRIADVEAIQAWLSGGFRLEQERWRAAYRVRVALAWRAIPARTSRLTRVLSMKPYCQRAMRTRDAIALLRAELPFGWTFERIPDRYAVRIGPWWLLGPQILWNRVRWRYTLWKLDL